MLNSSFIPQLILVDGSSYLYRAFYALPPLTNSKGEPTGAIYGVMNMIRRLAKDYAKAHIAVVFDAPGKTFRDELFESYKASRQPTPQEIIQQFPYLRDLVQAFGFPVLQISGVEADDVIGTLAVRAAKQNMQVLISTGDKDMAQLVNEHICLINTMSQKFYDREAVKAKFDIYPEQIIDYLALVGDSSDNIPGIPKVGPKTAAKWLNQYGSLESLQQHAHLLTGVVGENFRQNQEQLALSQKLATIKLDVDVPFQINEWNVHTPDLKNLLPLLKRLEFKAWLKEFLIFLIYFLHLAVQ